MLENKTILVAGAGGLLGGNLVKELISYNANVIAIDIDKSQIVKKLLDLDVNISSAQIRCLELDLTDKIVMVNFFKEIDYLDGVVNCAYPRNSNYGKNFFDVTLDDFNENISLNLGSCFLLMQQCALFFKKQNRDFSFVNVASIYGISAPKFSIYNDTTMTMPVEYAAMKAGLLNLSKYIVAYVNNSKFRVNSVSPGGILDKQNQKFLQAYKQHTLGKGMLEVNDVLGSIVFLLSSMSLYVNGQNIIIDDGFLL